MTREEAIIILNGFKNNPLFSDTHAQALDMAISALKGEWIPVSNRLPEERQSVLVWCPERRNIYCACLEKEQWWIFGAFTKVQDEVVAWMSLPEPYKADREASE